MQVMWYRTFDATKSWQSKNSHYYFLCPFINSFITSFQYTSLLERQCTNVSDFFMFRVFRIWNTRSPATEKISFPAELCHIWSCYFAKYFRCYWNSISFTLRFISLVIVFWHARWTLMVTPFFPLSDKHICNLSFWIKLRYWINLLSPLANTDSFSCPDFGPWHLMQKFSLKIYYFGYCCCHPWLNKCKF